MRVVFGVVSLLILLAVVNWTARAGLRAGAAPTAAASPALAAPSTAPTSHRQQQVLRDVDAALQQGRARNDAAERPDPVSTDPAGGPGTAGSAR